MTIKSYRADNLRFNDQAFQQSCHDAQLIFTYCGVGAHHQNAIAEAKNKQLSYDARKHLLHAKRLWPDVVKLSLWPFALLADTNRHNNLTLDETGRSPIENFSDTAAEIVCSDYHTWVCPCFILREANPSVTIGTPKCQP